MLGERGLLDVLNKIVPEINIEQLRVRRETVVSEITDSAEGRVEYLSMEREKKKKERLFPLNRFVIINRNLFPRIGRIIYTTTDRQNGEENNAVTVYRKHSPRLLSALNGRDTRYNDRIQDTTIITQIMIHHLTLKHRSNALSNRIIAILKGLRKF